MSFLNPAAFFFLLGIPAVIILHLLKIRRRQAVVSSTLLWADSLRDQQASAPPSLARSATVSMRGS